MNVSTQNQVSLNLKETHNPQLSNTISKSPQPISTSSPLLLAQANNTKCGPGTPRDKYKWPFACNSLWNMPIGSNARYVDAYIGSKGVGSDVTYFVISKSSDPSVPTYMPGAWGVGRCTGTKPQQQAQWHSAAAQPLNVPYDLIIPDAKPGVTPNNSSAVLKPDGKTLVGFNIMTRCHKGAPLYGTWFGQQSIYGEGRYGGHGGSSLSSLGGTIRKGELLNDQPIRHTLKLLIWAKWLNYNSSNKGRRWPADVADSNAASIYKGSNPALVMGSLLAIKPNVTAESLGITSKVGKKIFKALQDYGAYVVDDAGWDYNYFVIDHAAEMEYKNVTGNFLYKDAAFQADFNKMLPHLKVVDNNGSNNIGGGGTPRQPLAPPIGN